MTLAEQILKALAGASGQNPIRVDSLPKRIGVTQTQIDAELINLTERAAITGANITRDGTTFSVVWPTGMQPKALRCIRISPKATDTGPIPPTPLRQAQPLPLHKEPDMPRITAPAQTHGESINQQIVTLLSGVDKAAPMSFDDLVAHFPNGKPESLRAACSTLASRGLISRESKGRGRNAHTMYWQAVPGNAEAPAAKPSETEAALADAIIKKCSKSLIDDAGKSLLGQAIKEAYAEAVEPNSDATFSVDDAGNLTIFVDDEILQLDKPDARRLAIFLGATVGVFA